MNCDETLTLLAFRPLDALEGAEVGKVDRHLGACDACRTRADVLEDAYDLLTDPVLAPDEPEVPPGAWDVIVERLAQTAPEAPGDEVPAASGLPIAVVCTFCRGALVKADAAYCASCLAPHHADCFLAHGRCSAHGCEETSTVRPKLEVRLDDPATKSPTRRHRVIRIGVGLAVLGSVAALTWAQNRELDHYQQRFTQDALLQREAQAVEAEQRRRARTDELARLLPKGELPTKPRGAYLGALVSVPDGGAAGAEILETFPLSPAQLGGLQAGDVIVSIEGGGQEVSVAAPADLARHLQETFASFSRVTVVFLRRGHERRIRADLTEAGPPRSFLRGSPSGAAWVPAKVLGFDGAEGLLLATHRSEEQIFETYPVARMPDGELVGTVRLSPGARGADWCVNPAQLTRAGGESRQPFLRPGEVIWLRQHERDTPSDGEVSWTIDLSQAKRVTLRGPTPVYLGLELRWRAGRPGLCVEAVLPGGPADRAGLRRGDCLTGIRSDDDSLTLGNEPEDDLRAFMRGRAAGGLVHLVVERDERGQTFCADLDDPNRRALVDQININTQPPRLMATVTLSAWDDTTLLFEPTVQSYDLQGKTFAVSLPGGGEFARVRVDGLAGASRSATRLRGPGEFLDLPEGTPLVLMQIHPDERPSPLDTRVSQEFEGVGLRLPATYLAGCAGKTVILGPDLGEVVVSTEWREETVLQCLVDLATKTGVRIDIGEDVIRFAKQ